MLNIDANVKALFRYDVMHKNIVLTFPDITIQNDKISSESLVLTEVISSDDSLEFGSCNSSTFQITVADIDQELIGQEFTADIEIGTETVPLGIFTVAMCEKQTDRRLKNITAYDRMSKFDIDVSSWWNSITFNSELTVKVFRENLCSYCNVPYREQNLINDSIIVEKTISIESLTARDLLKACMEINGCFGHIDRYGYFEAVQLNSTVVEEYTAADYSSEDIPVHSDYTVSAIDKVQIKSEDDDIGGIYGTGTNAIVINSNFICYGKGADALNLIASNLYSAVSGITYKKLDGNFAGLPYLEVGDCITFQDGTSYVLSRTLSGIQALKDSISANGTETRSCVTDSNSSIERIKALTHILKNTVEELSSIIKDEENGLESEIVQLKNSILLKVSKEDLTGKNIVSLINLTPDSIKIDSKNIDLTGYVTISSMESEEETTTIVGCKITCSGTYNYTPMGETESQTFNSKSVLDCGRLTIDNGLTGNDREYVNYGWEGICAGNDPNNASGGVDLRSNIFKSFDGRDSYNSAVLYARYSPVGNMSKYNACILAPQYYDESVNPNKYLFSFHIRDSKGCLDFGPRTANEETGVFNYLAGLTFKNGKVIVSRTGNGSETDLGEIVASNIPLPIVSVNINTDETLITATLSDGSTSQWNISESETTGITFTKVAE